ncbi:3-phosphoserine/phosphohydroxythreonine transaminase [Glaciecola sp. XM2]|jgi:phosphoserine aminotransferase|uniref:3-phosphoserine/phosphohydroxythreonine transaminase n=1 Tax=Glaciecola sp. XM2 TaxID=1914931 RepID=UPI001BDE7BDC|nr:3-phosphoserine/phosphohydroxythreonine transaminase [Glaciecola sp. XM2]MBT1449601.1 3-phosphoserine/phosphohydroxythreonine transaminase [Glaciecola sp. XM2]
MQTIYNFSAGPAALPKEVLKQAQAEMLDWNNQGTSVMEVSHRGKPFLAIAQKAERDFRELLNIPENYKVLFLQGGGRGQFFSVPMNLAQRGDLSQHLVSGQWSQIAVSEAEKYMKAEIVAKTQTRDDKLWVPTQDNWEIDPSAAYFHYCPNETVDGIEINWVPKSESVPIVADMSSNILSKPIDVNDFGIIYAGAQKNIGPSGLAMVIIREDLVGLARPDTPAVFDYQQQVNNDSMYNTPPTFSWYLAGLVFEWLLAQGGVESIAKINEEKARLLYECIDSSDFYSNKVAHENRSKMNVCFQLADNSLDDTFLAYTQEQGLQALKGHRFVGGMRASIYNAMPLEGVKTLVECMKTFERKYG